MLLPDRLLLTPTALMVGRIPSRQAMGTKNRHTHGYLVPAFALTLSHTCPISVNAWNVLCSI